MRAVPSSTSCEPGASFLLKAHGAWTRRAAHRERRAHDRIRSRGGPCRRHARWDGDPDEPHVLALGTLGGYRRRSRHGQGPGTFGLRRESRRVQEVALILARQASVPALLSHFGALAQRAPGDADVGDEIGELEGQSDEENRRCCAPSALTPVRGAMGNKLQCPSSGWRGLVPRRASGTIRNRLLH